MDIQQQSDLMVFILCACQTKCLRYVKRKQEAKKKKEQNTFDLVSARKQARSCEVINHRTVYYE